MTLFAPWFGEIMFHVDEHDEPMRMYVYAQDLKDAAVEREYLDDEDELELCKPSNYRKGRNPLFVHLRGRGLVKRLWEHLQEWRIGED